MDTFKVVIRCTEILALFQFKCCRILPFTRSVLSDKIYLKITQLSVIHVGGSASSRINLSTFVILLHLSFSYISNKSFKFKLFIAIVYLQLNLKE